MKTRAIARRLIVSMTTLCWVVPGRDTGIGPRMLAIGIPGFVWRDWPLDKAIIAVITATFEKRDAVAIQTRVTG